MMNTQQINDRLTDLYLSSLTGLKQFYSQADKLGQDDYTNPLLLKCTDEYVNAQKKLLFIGQETNQWYNDYGQKVKTAEKIATMQENYWYFVLDQSYNTLFWRFIWDVDQKVNAGACGYLWNNVIKIGRASGLGTPDYRLVQLEEQYFNILKKEIEILKPDAVIFLSGPDYDGYIKNRLGSFTIKESFGKCFDRLQIPDLPEDTFRLYHPGYLNRAKLFSEYAEKLSKKMGEMV